MCLTGPCAHVNCNIVRMQCLRILKYVIWYFSGQARPNIESRGGPVRTICSAWCQLTSTWLLSSPRGVYADVILTSSWPSCYGWGVEGKGSLINHNLTSCSPSFSAWVDGYEWREYLTCMWSASPSLWSSHTEVAVPCFRATDNRRTGCWRSSLTWRSS